MIQLEIIRSHSINIHKYKFSEFCQLFNDNGYELKDVENKVNRDEDGFTTYTTFITYYNYS